MLIAKATSISTPSCESNSDQEELNSPTHRQLSSFSPVADETRQTEFNMFSRFEMCGCSASPPHGHTKLNENEVCSDFDETSGTQLKLA